MFSAAALVCAAALAAPVSAQMMGGHDEAKPLTAAQFAAASAGQMVQIEVRVRTIQRSNVQAQLLQQTGGRTAKNTGKTIRMFMPESTPVVMGSTSDVVPGAVLYVYGIVTKPGYVDAKRVVVATRYMTVQ